MGRKRRESEVFRALTRFRLLKPVELQSDDCISCRTVLKEHGLTHARQRYDPDVLVDLFEAHKISATEVARRGGIDPHHLLAVLRWEELMTQEDAFAIEYATGGHVGAYMWPSLRLQRERWWSLVRERYEKNPPAAWPKRPVRSSYKWSQARRLANRRKLRKRKGRDVYDPTRLAHEAPRFVDEAVTLVEDRTDP